ncbi:MAG: M48 family metalloprotease [bacterium]
MKTIISLMMLTVLLAGCESVPIERGKSRELDLLAATIEAASKAARPISETEEYYVGRAVAARLLSMYPLLKDQGLTEYVNLVGLSVALHSENPFTYGGYHFEILDTQEVNAFACPGGTIFITRGMIDAVRNEDELAAVLAHEVAHINHRDGIASIKKSRWTEALAVIGSEAAKQYGSEDLNKLVGLFEGSIDDVIKTLVVNGYGREQESDADKTALAYLAQTGYDPHALESFVKRLIEQGRGSVGGMLKTHPGTADRLENIEGNMSHQRPDPSFMQTRTRRFNAAVR